MVFVEERCGVKQNRVEGCRGMNREDAGSFAVPISAVFRG